MYALYIAKHLKKTSKDLIILSNFTLLLYHNKTQISMYLPDNIYFSFPFNIFLKTNYILNIPKNRYFKILFKALNISF